MIPILYIQMYIYINGTRTDIYIYLCVCHLIVFFVICAKLHYNGNFQLIYCVSLKTILLNLLVEKVILKLLLKKSPNAVDCEPTSHFKLR